MLIRTLLTLFCLMIGGYVWLVSSSSLSLLDCRPDLERLLNSSSSQTFRQERDRFLATAESRYGVPVARQLILALEPLTREAAAQPDGPLVFSPAALSRFWTGFFSVVETHQQSTWLSTVIPLGLLILVLSGWVWFESRQTAAWQELARRYLEKSSSSPALTRQLFVEWLESLQQQKERAMDRAIQLTFALNRERAALTEARRELAELRTVPHEDLFEPTSLTATISAGSDTADGASPDRTGTAAHSPSEPSLPAVHSTPLPPSLPGPPSHPMGVTTGPTPTSPLVFPTAPLVSAPLPSMPASSPAMSDAGTVETPAPPAPTAAADFETFTVADRYPTSGSLGDAPGREPTAPTSRSATAPTRSVRRLLSETQISEPSQLLPYIPTHPGFLPLSHLRQRREGVLVEIHPDLDDLLCLAQSYGPESVTRYYHSLIEFIDRCFLAFPSDLARDGYSLYWYSRIAELNQDDVLTTIRGEMPHVQWVGDEGVVSQIELRVKVHPLGGTH